MTPYEYEMHKELLAQQSSSALPIALGLAGLAAVLGALYYGLKPGAFVPKKGDKEAKDKEAKDEEDHTDYTPPPLSSTYLAETGREVASGSYGAATPEQLAQARSNSLIGSQAVRTGTGNES